jgi:SagB-type dehydrogenase family enzyme
VLQRAAARSVRRHGGRPRVPLPPPSLGDAALEDVLRGRRSRRVFAPAPLALGQLATLLWAAYGITGALELGGAGAMQQLRAAPSAGALYPLELFVAPLRVSGLERRIHHYDPLAHELERLPAGADVEAVSPDPALPGDAAAVVFAGAVFWRSRFKYGLRAYRFTLLEAGHAMQNLLLAAEGLGLVGVVLGGFFDDRVDRLLELDGTDESVLVGVCVGAS